jgi:hypothetical protein
MGLTLARCGNSRGMATVTADDVRALAKARGEAGEEYVLAFHDGVVKVESATEAYDESKNSKVIFTQAELLHQFGEEVTDAEAEMLAAALTARTTEQ